MPDLSLYRIHDAPTCRSSGTNRVCHELSMLVGKLPKKEPIQRLRALETKRSQVKHLWNQTEPNNLMEWINDLPRDGFWKCSHPKVLAAVSSAQHIKAKGTVGGTQLVDKGFLGFGPKLCKVLTTSLPGQHQKVHNIISLKVAKSNLCWHLWTQRERIGKCYFPVAKPMPPWFHILTMFLFHPCKQVLE